MLKGTEKAMLVLTSLTAAIVAQAAPPRTGLCGTVSTSPAALGAQREGESAISPFAGAVVEMRNPEGKLLAREQTDAKGHFKALVPAGSYRLRAHLPGSIFPRCGTTDVTVRADEVARVDIDCDSGRR